MPSKRKATDSVSPRSAQNGSRRQLSHASRACDACRRRKMRCDALHPQCSMCKDRGMLCEYKDEDRRKTNLEHMEQMNARMDRFEALIEKLLAKGSSDTPNLATSDSNLLVSSVPVSMPVSIEAILGQHGSRLQDPSKEFQAATLPAGELVDNANDYSIRTRIPELSVSPTDTRGSTRLNSLGDGDVYEQFQRVEEAQGTLIQFGPTSLWTCSSPRPHENNRTHDHILHPGDWINWSQHLPKSLDIDRATHDLALSYFGAFYAPWCYVVDMPGFMSDLALCNLVRGSETERSRPPSRTAHYSPLIHCCALYLGLVMLRRDHPGLVGSYESVFMQHCSPLLLSECDYPALSSLKAYNLYANCTHFVRLATGDRESSMGTRHLGTGYLYSGMAVAGVHALGLNVNCDNAVAKGEVTENERNQREYAFWTVYMMDTIRSLAAGRQPMLPDRVLPPLPRVDRSIDSVQWISPSISMITKAGSHASVSGMSSMRTTNFHWAARLAMICRSVLETLYAPGASRNSETVHQVSQRLELWFNQYPLRQPEVTPLPHVLLLHMTYHLVMIFVHRPFYRSSVPSSVDKCDQAAMSILHLLRLFDDIHSVNHCHHNLINVIFGASTIFLLRSVGTVDGAISNVDMQKFNQCVDYMSKLGLTWTEARMSREILLKLQSEYHNPIPEPLPDAVADTALSPFETYSDIQDIWGLTFPDQAFQWSDLSGI